ncbi:MAG: hypothetical protein JSS82_07210 [Bacteroidetes bacterium]|nr:hypothetical protein [Bacteroidota bacterium]
MRHLNEREKRLITCLLSQVADIALKNKLCTNLENPVVEDMNDGEWAVYILYEREIMKEKWAGVL